MAKPEQLYDKDFYAWTLDQAAVLRQLPPTDGVDLGHLAEEIEDLGSEQLRKVTSQLRNLLAHLLKAAFSRNAQVLGHWRRECRAFQLDARDHYSASMRRRIDLEDVFRGARRMAVDDFEDAGEPVPALPSACPFALDDLLDPDFNFDTALERLRLLNH